MGQSQSVGARRGGGGGHGLWFTNLGEGPSLQGQQGPVSRRQSTETKTWLIHSNLCSYSRIWEFPFPCVVPQTPGVIALISVARVTGETVSVVAGGLR